MNILITGSGGFIGGFMVEKALSEGFSVWAGVRKSTSREYLQDPGINFVDLTFHNSESLKKQLSTLKSELGRWDVIIHNLGVTKCLDPDDFEKINYGFLKNFTEALIETDMVPSQFILMSSLSAYGPGDEINMTPIKISDDPTPNTGYGRSKLLSEQHVKSLSGFPYVIMRPTGVYGPRDKDYYLMVKTIKSGFDVSAGFRPQRITFIYVKDLVNCVFKAIERGVTRSEYIVAEGRDYSSSDFRRYAQKELNKNFILSLKVPLSILFLVSVISEYVSRLTGKPGTLNRDKYKIMKQRNWICDISAIRDELDFNPEYSLEKGVGETIRWYKENKWL